MLSALAWVPAAAVRPIPRAAAPSTDELEEAKRAAAEASGACLRRTRGRRPEGGGGGVGEPRGAGPPDGVVSRLPGTPLLPSIRPPPAHPPPTLCPPHASPA